MITVQEVLQRFYSAYRKLYKPSPQQLKAVSNIVHCRTSVMGGHVQKCDKCDHIVVHYNSCRDRHCPMCQGLSKAVWVDKRSKDVLKAPYFHLVFTMPQELHALMYQNQKLLYSLFYRAVAGTLQELSWDKKYLGAQPGFLLLLHTWGQDLHYHPHIHVVLMAGGLTKLNQWRSSSKKFFIPVKVLSKKFRGKYLYYLKQHYHQNELKFYGDAEKYGDAGSFQELIDRCYAKDWYTYTRRTFSGPLAVLKYLGNYTRRIAISNSRIVSVDEESVTISVRDYSENSKKKMISMEGVEFVRRFLMHILPKGFVKIRYYGVMASRNKKTKLELCRKLSFSPMYKPKYEGLSTLEILCLLVGKDVTICPVCREGKLRQVHSLCPCFSP